MPKTKYVKRKRTRRVGKSRPLIKSLAKKVNKLYSSIEHKYLDSGGAAIVLDNNPTIHYRFLQGITTGTTDASTRIGDKITLGSTIRWRSVMYTAPETAAQTVRLIAFVVKQNPDGIAVAFSTIINLYLNSSYMNSPLAVLAPQDYDNRFNFVTLYDQKKTIHPGAAGTLSQIQWDANIRVPSSCRNIQYFNSTAGISKNELIIALISQYDSTVTMDYSVHFTYTDT